MQIERLIIRRTVPSYEIIRDISFNLDGLNLIVDNTTKTADDSGNNIGKSTALKIIDLCLGARSVRRLYYDNDTKTENIKVKKFLNDFKVEAELILVNYESGENYHIIRQLFNRGKRSINGEVYKAKDFKMKLKEILFNLNAKSPSLRQLIPKFVRVNGPNSENMIKYLPSTSNDTYDIIYMFLFKILNNRLLNKKDELAKQLSECEKKLKMYEKDDNIASLDILKQRKVLVDKDLQNLKSKRKKLDYMDKYKEELENKRELSTKVDLLEEKIQLLELDIEYVEDNIKRLINEKNNIDSNQINHIYKEANAYLDNIDKTFDDVLNFHNQMIENRIKFIRENLVSKEKKLNNNLLKRDDLLNKKKEITVNVLDEGLLDELNNLNSSIDELNLEKGEITRAIKIVQSVKDERHNIIDRINEINNEMNPDRINEKIEVFNYYFSDYCEKLYGEKYLFVYNNNWKKENKFPVSLDYFKGNVGTGMKKGVIVAFDLAYMKYAQDLNFKAPLFIIHDKLENTHINQLKTIFEITQNIKGQYIAPILRERIDKIDSSLVNKSKILELSSDDKFFKI